MISPSRWRSWLACLLLVGCGSPQRALREPPQQQARSSRAFELVYASTRERDCHAEHIVCFRQCWNSQPPYPIKRGDKGHDKHCTELCRKEYMECVKETEASQRTFPDMKTAKDWLDSHKTEIVVGSIVVVAGTVFVVGTLGAGALVLVPLVAL